MKKLDAKGFSHHLLLPVLAISLIAGAGAYLVNRSKAATENGSIAFFYFNGSTSKGYTIKDDGAGLTTFSNAVSASTGNTLTRTSDNRYVVHGQKTSNFAGKTVYTDPQSSYTGCVFPDATSTTGTQYIRGDQTVKPPIGTSSVPVVTYVWVKHECSKSYYGAGPAITASLNIVNAKGSNKSVLVPDTKGSVFQLAWGPAGDRLFMLRSQPNSFGISEIVVHTGDGSLRTLASGVTGYALSGNGKKIVYVVPKYSGVDEFYIMNSDGSNKKLVFSGQAGSLNEDSLNATGTQFVYKRWASDATSLIVVNTNSGATRVAATANLSSNIQDFSWSPTGDKIAYMIKDDSAKKYELFVVKPSGSARLSLQSGVADSDRGGFGHLDW